uniref:Uncharacterized protein n=1 Tax=Cacopsylla melanoneura TaxID=428564 RepID=A0A8D8SLE6_9HEMI
MMIMSISSLFHHFHSLARSSIIPPSSSSSTFSFSSSSTFSSPSSSLVSITIGLVSIVSIIESRPILLIPLVISSVVIRWWSIVRFTMVRSVTVLLVAMTTTASIILHAVATVRVRVTLIALMMVPLISLVLVTMVTSASRRMIIPIIIVIVILSRLPRPPGRYNGRVIELGLQLERSRFERNRDLGPCIGWRTRTPTRPRTLPD